MVNERPCELHMNRHSISLIHTSFVNNVQSHHHMPPPTCMIAVNQLEIILQIAPPLERAEDDHETMRIMPIGAGNEVGRSCIILKYMGKTIMLDCGIHPVYSSVAVVFFCLLRVGHGGVLRSRITTSDGGILSPPTAFELFCSKLPSCSCPRNNCLVIEAPKYSSFWGGGG